MVGFKKREREGVNPAGGLGRRLPHYKINAIHTVLCQEPALNPTRRGEKEVRRDGA